MNKHENLNSPENLVSDILNHKIYLKNISDKSIDALEEIGASQKQIAGTRMLSFQLRPEPK